MLLNIVSSTPDSGQFDWIPSTSGVDYGMTGLRIQISLVDSPIAFDRSVEASAVPENTNAFYVNDRDSALNTFTTAVGSNRNTGKLPQSPKPLPTAITRVYTVGPGQTIYVDPGTYDLPTRMVNGNVLNVSDDEGYVLTGTPISPATLRIQNPNTLAPVLELVDADFTTVANLVLSGGQYGLWVREGSTDVTLRNLTATAASLDGIRIEAGSGVAEFDRVQAINNNRSGISSAGSVGWLHDSIVRGNRATGIALVNPGAPKAGIINRSQQWRHWSRYHKPGRCSSNHRKQQPHSRTWESCFRQWITGRASWPKRDDCRQHYLWSSDRWTLGYRTQW